MLGYALRIAAVSIATVLSAVNVTWAQGREAVPTVAPTDPRVALVIGNSFYKSVNPLANPANDAQAIGQTLNRAGFEVITAINMNRADMRRLASDFAARVAEKGPNTVALVFYAGHGLQVDGENFLVPVDARIASEADVSDQTMALTDVMKTLQTVQSRIRIFILDACQNNPFAALQTGHAHGLAFLEAPTDTLLAYSTAPGTEAVDGSGQHSPYAAALLTFINQPGVLIEQMFKQVRLQVHQQTGGKQTPWDMSALTTNFAFVSELPGSAIAEAPATVKVASNAAIRPAPSLSLEELKTRPAEQAYWYVIAEDSDEYYEEFIRLYPDHPLCDQIRRFLARRKDMVDWRDAVLLNTPEAYNTYLSRHPHTDHELSALRLRVTPRPRPLDAIFAPRPNNEARRLAGRDAGVVKANSANGSQLNNVVDNRQQLFAAENARKGQLQALNAERARLQAERENVARLNAERERIERLNTERLNAQRLAAQRLNAQRLNAERLNAERLRVERQNLQRLEARRSSFATNRFQFRGQANSVRSSGFASTGRFGGGGFGRR